MSGTCTWFIGELDSELQLGFDRCDRGREAHSFRASRYVPLPAAPCDREALIEKEAVAGVDLGGRLHDRRCAVVQRQQGAAPSVRHLHDAGSASTVEWAQERHITLEAHQAVIVGGGQFEVDDAGVGPMRWIDGVGDDRRRPVRRGA